MGRSLSFPDPYVASMYGIFTIFVYLHLAVMVNVGIHISYMDGKGDVRFC